MICWKCSHNTQDITKIGFRTLCERCSAWQHVCLNCQFYHPGAPNDCKIPGTENIRDRESANFCDEFKVQQEKAKERTSLEDVSERLFGKSESNGTDISAEEKFRRLFDA